MQIPFSSLTFITMIAGFDNGIVFLRVIGVLGTLAAWIAVSRPAMKVYWGRGSNRPPMSLPSRLAVAISISGWCLGVFGCDSRVAISLFAIGFAGAAVFGQMDKERHTAKTSTTISKP